MIVGRAQNNIACTSSARGLSRNIDMPYNTVWKNLRKIIHFYSCKINRLQKLHYTYHQKRLTFALTFPARMEVDVYWLWKIIWGDQPHFYLIGTVDTQNCQIWMEDRQMQRNPVTFTKGNCLV